MPKTRVQHFDHTLKYYGLNKRDFAEKSKIPYDTVAGWKRSANVPDYAFVLLKHLVFLENHRTRLLKVTPPKTVAIDDRLAKEIQVAFWGKEYDPFYVLKEVKARKEKFVKPFFENLYYKDILKLLSIKNIEKLLPTLKKIFNEEKVLFWENIVKHYRQGTPYV